MSSRSREPGMPGRRTSARHRAAAGIAAFATAAGSLLAGVALPAHAEPGNPGTPGEPLVLFTEDFQNRATGSNIMLSEYSAVTGGTYTADLGWISRPGCNGFIIDHSSPWVVNDCNASGFAAQNYDLLTAVPFAIGLMRGGLPPQENAAVAAYTATNLEDNAIQFRSSTPLSLPVANRFVTFSVDAAAENCFASHPQLRFYLEDGAGTEHPVSSSAIDPCTDPRSGTVTVPSQNGVQTEVRGGTFAANSSMLLNGGSFGVVMRNENGSGEGNDGAFDNIQVLDVSPQLDKAFVPARVPAGGTTKLTFTVTNTSELAAKDGWAFTDTLPAGLVVAPGAATGSTCAASTVAAPEGGSSITVTGGTLVDGQASCTVSVDVTSASPQGAEASPKVYSNGPGNLSNVVGLNLPGTASVEFYSTPALSIEKSSDLAADSRVGSIATYTVAATNTGNGDFSGDHPAIVLDDLSAVLDDGTLVPGSLLATVDGQPVAAPAAAGSLLSWSGPLAVGKTVRISYQVTTAAGGDLTLRNVAWEPKDPAQPAAPSCTELTDGRDAATGEACAATENTILPAEVTPSPTPTPTDPVTPTPTPTVPPTTPATDPTPVPTVQPAGDDLADTGAGMAVPLLGLGMILTVAGAAFTLFLRRRRA